MAGMNPECDHINMSSNWTLIVQYVALSIMAVTTACSAQYEVSIRNTDIVPLNVTIEVSDGSGRWKFDLQSNEMRTFSVSPRRDSHLNISLETTSREVVTQQIGYFSTGGEGAHDALCIIANRRQVSATAGLPAFCLTHKGR